MFLQLSVNSIAVHFLLVVDWLCNTVVDRVDKSSLF